MQYHNLVSLIDLEILKSTLWVEVCDNTNPPTPPPWQGRGWVIIMECIVPEAEL
jgi:hypothetical protein